MKKLQKEERETCILVNDLGECTIWTTSPLYERRLTRRLGKSALKGGLARWDLPASRVTWMPRLKRQKPPLKGGL